MASGKSVVHTLLQYRIIAAALAVIGVPLIVYGGFGLLRFHHLQRDGATAVGILVTIQQNSGATADTEYRYYVDGHAYTGADAVGSAEAQTMHEGENIEVLYLTSDPSQAMMRESRPTSLYFTLICGFACIFLLSAVTLAKRRHSPA